MFYDQYLDLCNKKGEKPYAVARKLGSKSNSVVAQWQKGSTPRPDMLQKIADYFGVDVTYLMGYGQKEQPTPESELNEELISRLISLTHEEVEKVDAFVQGLLAAR